MNHLIYMVNRICEICQIEARNVSGNRCRSSTIIITWSMALCVIALVSFFVVKFYVKLYTLPILMAREAITLTLKPSHYSLTLKFGKRVEYSVYLDVFLNRENTGQIKVVYLNRNNIFGFNFLFCVFTF